LRISAPPVIPRDDLCAVPVLDVVVRKKPDGGLLGRAADEQVRGTGQDFVVGVRPNNFEGKVFVKHRVRSF
jgi:hypothetical protein